MTLFGCQTASQKPMNPQSNQGTVPRSQNLSTAPADRMNLTDAEARILARKFANMADEVTGVQKATAVVTEGTMTGATNRTQTGVTINNDRFNGMSNMATPPGPGTVTNPAARNNQGIVVMIGLDVDRSMINNTAEMERLKTRVANKILRADNRVSRVYVTTDPELMKRISDMADNMVSGRPLSNMRTDMNNLLDRMKGESSAF